ncbi:hypothetical protein [Nocardiopsis deserti]|uniref:hypothetical protein n=1 Tax=Nocardiopsis deserti TaxID=2605988 RepID=UPI00123B1D34|nr:hypothetical protein [Nocardiopsis deserti]
MTDSPYVQANSGGEAPRWRTFDGPVVLALARTFTSAVRVLESLTLFRGDTRVLFVFAYDGTSAFNAGTERLLAEHQVCLVPWESRLEVEPALVLTATENADLTGFSCPVVVLPHGVGFQKYVPDHRSGGVRLSGVPRPEFHDADNVHLVLSHPAQREQLRAARVPLAEHAVVVGDPARDRLLAGRRMRDRYRERMGVRPDQRLVVATSTWGPEGLIGSRPLLPGSLLGALPHDGYRVAAVLHPNVWFAHSPWQVRHMLADALDAGLLLIPPHSGWGAAMVAADCVVGDHGSVTLYGAAMDHPVLLAAMGSESVPGTAVSELARTAARLAPEDLRRQVEAAIDGHRPGLHSGAADLAFAHPGQGWRRLTELLYGLLGLEPRPSDRVGEDTGRSLPPPVADPATGTPRSFEVHGRLEGPQEVSLERFPAASRTVPDPPHGTFRHLCAYETEERDALANSASVVCRDAPPGEADHGTAPAGSWAARTLRSYPGALAVACATGPGTLLVVRDGRRFLVRSRPPLPPALAAGAVYTFLRSSAQVPDHVKVWVGSVPRECVVESLPPSDPSDPGPA